MNDVLSQESNQVAAIIAIRPVSVKAQFHSVLFRGHELEKSVSRKRLGKTES